MLKFVAAILMASALFLPLSSCQRYMTSDGTTVEYIDRDGNPVPPGQGQPSGATPVRELAKE